MNRATEQSALDYSQTGLLKNWEYSSKLASLDPDVIDARVTYEVAGWKLRKVGRRLAYGLDASLGQSIFSEMLYCCNCGRWLLACEANFHRNRQGLLGYYSFCRSCKNEVDRTHKRKVRHNG